MADRLDRELETLTPNERAVLTAIAMQSPPDTYAEAGRTIGISKQRVSQITKSLQLKGLIKKREIMVYTVSGEKIADRINTTEEPRP